MPGHSMEFEDMPRKLKAVPPMAHERLPVCVLGLILLAAFAIGIFAIVSSANAATHHALPGHIIERVPTAFQAE